VAISNHRIQNIDKEQNTVSFHYKDYRDHGKQKLTTLSGVEFLRRFCLHILPKGFVKIRYYGILSNRYARQTAMYRKPKQNRSKETAQQRLKRLTGFDVFLCPWCKKGYMHTVEELPRIIQFSGYRSFPFLETSLSNHNMIKPKQCVILQKQDWVCFAQKLQKKFKIRYLLRKITGKQP